MAKKENLTFRIRPDYRERLEKLRIDPNDTRLRSLAHVIERCLSIALPILESDTAFTKKKKNNH